MNDPAVEAAQRARGVTTLHPAHSNADELALAAAHEALKPIRERHIPVDGDFVIPHKVCQHCDEWWPCKDAQDAYTTEELDHG